MLVLSRRLDEKIVFPNLGVTVQILRIAGNVVRVGVEAPREVKVLRHEIAETPPDSTMLPAAPEPCQACARDVVRLLESACGLLITAQQKAKGGPACEAEQDIREALAVLQKLDHRLDAPSETNDCPRRRPTALLVDDDENESELLAGYLRISGYDVETAQDGLEAIRRLSHGDCPDIVLLDMRMPRLDGPKTVTSIRCHPKCQGLKVFAVSGAARTECRVTVGPRGVDRWFTKPINPERLVQAMRHDLQDAWNR